MKTYLPITQLFLLILLLPNGTSWAQATHASSKESHGHSVTSDRPKLVVAISIDQFRYDYLLRFQHYFGPRGFNLFLKGGANFANAHYSHSQTSTGPGHAVIMSGTYGNVNGIIANNWYDPTRRAKVYCVEDKSHPLLGGHTGAGRSPANFNGSTVGDQLRLSNHGKSKVISISRKDRTAILMGGKLATAYWIGDSSYTTSTYYMKALPEWLKKFNRTNRINAVNGSIWRRLLAEKEYTETQGPDDMAGEQVEFGKDRTFPHTIEVGTEKKASDRYKAFQQSPFESELLVKLAKEVVSVEELGQRDVTDILCVGFSANDATGHVHGPDSHEVMDLAIRTDRLLEELFHFLDEEIGLQNCALVLTADHGVMPLPEVLNRLNPNIPIQRIDDDDLGRVAEEAMVQAFGVPGQDQYVGQEGGNIYFHRDVLADHGIQAAQAELIVRERIEKEDYVYAVYTRSQLMAGQISNNIGGKVLDNFSTSRSGDLFVQLLPFVSTKEKDGTGHGGPWSYDSHVPMLWYSSAIKPGTFYQAVSIADIAPTLAAILQVEFPAACQGRVLFELFK